MVTKIKAGRLVSGRRRWAFTPASCSLDRD